ncbi:unnamed protein product [Eruca vesicaria subsp. sativa]|uniref:Uncharacterized protein n=1 Tax=Eruca vesicaria subsp. sativa TaxID=29727 RepID=A0ABC8L237_ERUVS|nr:unnamed protein product [Eruca vesicaria subsp. sativa]
MSLISSSLYQKSIAVVVVVFWSSNHQDGTPFLLKEIKGFSYQEHVNGFSFGFSLISDDMLNSSSSSELMNFDSFVTWCDNPSETDTLFAQYGLTTSQPMPFGATTSSHAAELRS